MCRVSPQTATAAVILVCLTLATSCEACKQGAGECKNGGKCMYMKTARYGAYKCQCALGFTGTTCQVDTLSQKCEKTGTAKRCLNGGTCKELDIEAELGHSLFGGAVKKSANGLCECVAPYWGVFCETRPECTCTNGHAVSSNVCMKYKAENCTSCLAGFRKMPVPNATFSKRCIGTNFPLATPTALFSVSSNHRVLHPPRHLRAHKRTSDRDAHA